MTQPTENAEDNIENNAQTDNASASNVLETMANIGESIVDALSIAALGDIISGILD